MSLGTLKHDTQAKLKVALQDDPSSGKLETLAAALIGNLLGVTVAVAKSGFQHGGDAGSSGRQGRRLRIETKKYADSTSLSDRELLGEIDHALARDQSLEAWILVATREVPEQLEQDLNQKGESVGVPVLVLDFKSSDSSSLAALCSHAPELVEQLFSPKAGDLARALTPALTDVVDRLRRDLEAWQLGFEVVRRRSLAVVSGLWTDSRKSVAALGQNAAGGSVPQRIRRRAVHDRLTEWWDGIASNDGPAVLVGWDGVGKTWAAIDWLVDKADRLPIVLVVPSSALGETPPSELGVKRFIADRLYSVAGVRDRDHWLRRLDRLLTRPAGEGPLLILFFDGMNQESSYSWLSALKVLQADPFAGRVRVVASTRRHHYETRLSRLGGLVVPAVVVPVDEYDSGELDQMLELHGIQKSALHPDLLTLARTPRLFRLVVTLHSQFAGASGVTIHRLLWEYGRDSFGERAGRSFSESEWRDWLREIATRYRSGVRTFSLRALGETTLRPDLVPGDIDARLSDVIDGRFATTGLSGEFQLNPTIVAHSLGMALLSFLESTSPNTFGSLQNSLNQWLDPIADFDQRAEILRAAVSLAIERPAASVVAGVLVTAWLQSQNIPDTHRSELGALTQHLPDALLDAVEHSDQQTHASARSWAVRALCSANDSSEGLFAAIVGRLRRWCGVVSREMWYRRSSEDSEKHHSERLVDRIGVDRAGAVTVLGVQLDLVDDDDEGLASLAARLLERFPLERARPVFEVAAVANAVNRRSRSWDGLKWQVLLNEHDPNATRAMLRELSSDIRARTPEPGVHPELANRAAALVLWMSGTEDDARVAAALNPGFDRVLSYDRDYLPNPAHSLFALERRHAAATLTDTSLPLHVRIQKTQELWFDPTFEPPQSFVAEIRQAIADVDVGSLDGHAGRTVEDHALEESEPVLARCAPDLLADLARRRIRNYPNRKADERYWLTLGATSHFLIAGEEEREAARSLRRLGTESKPSHELYAAGQLLILEMRGQSALAQAVGIIQAGVEALLLDVAATVAALSKSDVDELIHRFVPGSPAQRRMLLFVLANRQVDLSDGAWSWIREMASDPDTELRGAAFRILALSNPSRFGGELYARGWIWSSKTHHWEADYGSIALIQGVIEVPFEQVAPRIAPWRLLEAARRRGSEPADVRLACGILSRVLGASGLEDPDPGAALSVDRIRDHDGLFRYSVSPIDTEPESSDSAEAFRRAFDREGQDKAYARALRVAAERVRLAREAGADLYLADVPAEDMEIAVLHCSDVVSKWIEGCEDITDDFERRVHLAEGAFLAICEALLKLAPARGVSLYRALQQTLSTRFIGPAGVDELLHVALRAPESPDVDALLADLLAPVNTHSDKSLLDLAIAATLNGRGTWLQTLVANDEASESEWRKRRGIVLRGFLAGNRLPVDGAWPEGEAATLHESLRRKAAKYRYVEACAHHWWNTFLTAPDEIAANAAWTLFVRSSDRRAWAWIDESVDTSVVTDPAFRDLHFRLNRSKLERAMEKREDKLDRQFLGQDRVEGAGPWM